MHYIIYFWLSLFFTNVGLHYPYLKFQHSPWSTLVPTPTYTPINGSPFEYSMMLINATPILFTCTVVLYGTLHPTSIARKIFDTRDPTLGSNNHHSSNTWSSWSKPSALIPLVGRRAKNTGRFKPMSYMRCHNRGPNSISWPKTWW